MILPVIKTSPTFFAAGVKLSEGISTVVLANWLVVMAAIIGKALQKVLFGELRLIEIEHIYERSRFTVLNSLIALTMFSNDFLLVPGILTLFSLFMKVFHWVLQDRFDYIFQNATSPAQVIRTRNTMTLFLLLYVDFNLVYSCVEYSFGNNPDVYFAFGFEFAVMFLDLLLQGSKVLLNTWELVYLRDHPEEDVMESKSLYMKILEIAHSSLVLIIHLFLLVTLLGPYRYPVYLFKDVFFNVLNLFKQVRELRRYQKASKELDTKLKDATQEELTEDNNLCIICRDDMTTIGVRKGERAYPKKLQCGHIIHLGCLKGWFERSQACPMCRAPVFTEPASQTTAPNANNGNEQEMRQRVQDEDARVRNIQQQLEAQVQQIQRNQPVDPIAPPPFLNQHIPHTSGFFRSPEATRPATSSGAVSNVEPINENVLTLRHNSLVPPDWTLLKLSNASPTNDEYQMRLGNGITAQIKKLSQEQKIDPFKFSKKEEKKDEIAVSNQIPGDILGSTPASPPFQDELRDIEERMRELRERVKNFEKSDEV